MLDFVVFVLALVVAMVAASIIVMMFAVSQWYANKVTKMTMEMSKNMMHEMEDMFK